MFHAILIQAGTDAAPLLRSLVAATGQVTVMRELPALPGDYELARLLNSLLPDLVFVDLSGGQPSLECLARIRELAPNTPVVGLCCPPESRLLARHLGVAALVARDCTPDELRVRIREAMEACHGGALPHLFAFLPAKAGSGCSTVVLHTALAAARFGKRVLVLDADLRSSVMALLLGATPSGGMQSVLREAASLDAFILGRNLVQAHGADFLLSTRDLDAELPEWAQYFRLLNFVRESYDLILADLPELINPATVEIVRRAARVFPVCTPELPSLKLALQRLEELRRLKVQDERIGLLVNRTSRETPPAAELEEALGRPAAFSFPNDYRAVAQSIHDAAPLDARSPLARAFAGFAARLADVELAPSAPSFKMRLKGLLHLSSA